MDEEPSSPIEPPKLDFLRKYLLSLGRLPNDQSKSSKLQFLKIQKDTTDHIAKRLRIRIWAGGKKPSFCNKQDVLDMAQNVFEQLTIRASNKPWTSEEIQNTAAAYIETTLANAFRDFCKKAHREHRRFTPLNLELSIEQQAAVADYRTIRDIESTQELMVLSDRAPPRERETMHALIIGEDEDRTDSEIAQERGWTAQGINTRKKALRKFVRQVRAGPAPRGRKPIARARTSER